MLIRNQIDAIYGGVNQQSAEQRLTTQVEEMVNCYPALNLGLLKRNPTKNLVLSDAITYENDMYVYSYDRGDTSAEDENYSIHITSLGMEIVDIVNGNVSKLGSGITYEGSAESYLVTNFAGKNGYSALTIKDTTFIVNKTIKPKLTSDTFPTTTTKKKAYIWVKDADAQYGFSYTYSLDNGTNQATATVTDTNTVDVASALATSINGQTGYTATSVGSVVEIVSTLDITKCEVTDTFGNEASRSFVDEVETISDLPATLGYEDVVVKIIGTAGTTTPYYVLYDNGIWRETISGSVNYKVDVATMPKILVRNTDGTFTVKEYDGWADRTIGDDDITPIPSIFTDDNVIKDIFFLRNRLGFITDTTVVLSEVAKYGNFFRTTALSLLDSDPIDVLISSTKSIILQYAINMEDSLLLTSDKIQFRLKDVDVLSPQTIDFIQSSAYEISRDVRPLSSHEPS